MSEVAGSTLHLMIGGLLSSSRLVETRLQESFTTPPVSETRFRS